jgi:lauroyl/myristoyl acyltransferase
VTDSAGLSLLDLLERIARRCPLPLGLWLADRLGRGYARLALSTGGPLHPWRVEDFPAQLSELLGEPADPGAASRRLVEDRLAFVITQGLVRRAVRRGSPVAARRLVPRIEVRGEPHLAAALARGRGTAAISTHFGYSHLISPVLADRGVRLVAPAATPRQPTDVQVSGGVRTRVRALRRMRTELAQNSVCVLLPDRGPGRVARVPFFRKQLHIGGGGLSPGCCRRRSSPRVLRLLIPPPPALSP